MRAAKGSKKKHQKGRQGLLRGKSHRTRKNQRKDVPTIGSDEHHREDASVRKGQRPNRGSSGRIDTEEEVGGNAEKLALGRRKTQAAQARLRTPNLLQLPRPKNERGQKCGQKWCFAMTAPRRRNYAISWRAMVEISKRGAANMNDKHSVSSFHKDASRQWKRVE